jgi:hypothetical protein
MLRNFLTFRESRHTDRQPADSTPAFAIARDAFAKLREFASRTDIPEPALARRNLQGAGADHVDNIA